MKNIQCECIDKLCSVHTGTECQKQATTKLRRIDFVDQPACYFCDACANDAFESGVFA